MRKILLTTAALGAAAAMPSASVTASQSAPLYCVPPANAQAAAHGETSATAAVLAAYKPGSLAALRSVAATVGSSGPGRITITITAKAHHIPVGRGSESVKGAGCEQIDIRLTGVGRKLLKRSKTITLNIVGVFAPSRAGGRAVAKGSVTLS
jgi:hypothetical protein